MTATDRRWPVALPAALALLVAAELAAYLLVGPVTTTGAGRTTGALGAGNAFLVGLAAAVVAGAAVGVAAAAREDARLVWLAAAALALLGVAGVAVGPQVLVVALLLVLSALLAEARAGHHPRRDGTEPPERRPAGESPDGAVVDRSPPDAGGVDEPTPDGAEPEANGTAGGEASGRTTGDEEPERTTADEPPFGGGIAGRADPADGPDREVVLAAALVVPLAALLGTTVLTAPVARPAVAATAAVVLAGSALSVWAVARS